MKITRKRRWGIKERCVECNQLVKHKTRNFKELCEDNEKFVISREKECPKCGLSWHRCGWIYYRNPKLRKITRRRFK